MPRCSSPSPLFDFPSQRRSVQTHTQALSTVRASPHGRLPQEGAAPGHHDTRSSLACSEDMQSRREGPGEGLPRPPKGARTSPSLTAPAGTGGTAGSSSELWASGAAQPTCHSPPPPRAGERPRKKGSFPRVARMRALAGCPQSVSQSLLSGSPPAAAAARARSLTFRLVFGGHFPSARHILLHRLLLATGTRQARAPLPLPPPPPPLLSARLFLLLLLPLLPLPLPPLLLTLPCRRGPSCCGRRFLLHHYHNHHHRAGRRARAASSHTPRASHWSRECTDAPADQPPLAGGGPEERMGLTDSAHGLRAVGSAGGRDKRGEAYRRRSNGHDCREGV